MCATKYRLLAGAGGAGLLLGLASVAEASLISNSILFDPDGGGNLGQINVDRFNFMPGNALSIGAVPAYANYVNNNPPVRTNFDSLLQARLKDMQLGATGTPVTLATGKEMTLTLRTSQQISNVIAVNSTTTQIVGTGVPSSASYLDLWYDTNANANDATGSGFNDGQLILHAVMAAMTSTMTAVTGMPPPMDQFGADDYLGIGAANLTGSASYGSTVVSYDPAFFRTALTAANFATALSAQFTLVDPAAQFWDGSSYMIPTVGAINGQSGPDIRFQTTSELTFRTVDEPHSVVLFALGLLWLLAQAFGSVRTAPARPAG